MLISVICVYNNKKQFEDQFLKSYLMQSVNGETVFIDNTEGRFSSASEALNYGASKAKGDVLIFSHQDIYLKKKDELQKMGEIIMKFPVGTIVGTQGVREKSRIYYENLTAGSEYNSALSDRYPLEPIEVSCVDEGLFGMRRETWENHPFDEKICRSWHLYAVEACLFARQQGSKVIVFPIQIHHFSRGKINISYMSELRKLCEHYRKSFRCIWTTCYKVKTNRLYMDVLILLWVSKRLITGRKL